MDEEEDEAQVPAGADDDDADFTNSKKGRQPVKVPPLKQVGRRNTKVQPMHKEDSYDSQSDRHSQAKMLP